MASSLFSSLNIGKIVGGINNGVSIFNKALPIYKEVKPIVQNVKSAFNTVNSVKNEVINNQIKEAKTLERPLTIFKKNKTNSERSEFDLDTLTFFQ